MANKPCPKCGTVLWFWRDETGCSKCNPDEVEILGPDSFGGCDYPLDRAELERDASNTPFRSEHAKGSPR